MVGPFKSCKDIYIHIYNRLQNPDLQLKVLYTKNTYKGKLHFIYVDCANKLKELTLETSAIYYLELDDINHIMEQISKEI
jgi:hypothetical protein